MFEQVGQSSGNWPERMHCISRAVTPLVLLFRSFRTNQFDEYWRLLRWTWGKRVAVSNFGESGPGLSRDSPVNRLCKVYYEHIYIYIYTWACLKYRNLLLHGLKGNQRKGTTSPNFEKHPYIICMYDLIQYQVCFKRINLLSPTNMAAYGRSHWGGASSLSFSLLWGGQRWLQGCKTGFKNWTLIPLKPEHNGCCLQKTWMRDVAARG